MPEKTLNELMAKFLKLGGSVSKHYLDQNKRYSQVTVNLNGWYSGKNVREAIKKAILSQ